MKWSVRQIIVGILFAAAGLVLLGIVGLVVWRVRLANRIEHEFAAIRAAGLPTNGVEANDYYPAVPDEENAAVKMAEAFASLTNYPDQRANNVDFFKIPSRKEAFTPEQTELLSGYVVLNSNAIVLAGEAVKLPRCRYPIDLSWGAGTSLPHLTKLKKLALLAAYQARLDTNASATAIYLIPGLARTLETEPVTISKLVRISMLSLAEQALERRLNERGFSEAELEELGRSFAGADKTNQMVNALIGERAAFARYFRMSYAEMKRYSQGDGDDSSEQNGPALPGPQPAVFKITGLFERDLLFYLQAMQTNIVLAATFPKNVAVIEGVEARTEEIARHNLYILSSLLLPALGNVAVKEGRSLAQVRSAQTALAVERFRLVHGALPVNLAELVPEFLSTVPADPFDGQPMRYHRLEKGYVIYSVGSDGEDNGGREPPDRIKTSDKTHYDVTFTVER